MRGRKRKDRSDGNGFEAWGGYMNAKITKLEDQFSEAAQKVDSSSEKISSIFEGVSIFVNGYTNPSADELRQLMLLHGGVYHHYHRSQKTTHVIATNLPNAKMGQMKTMKVVKPNWITESIAAGKLLDYKQYLLFNGPSAIEAGFKVAAEKQEAKEQKQSAETKGETSRKATSGTAKTAVDAQFLSEFYSNSRLHHLSTMGAMFKQYVGELRDRHGGTFAGRERLRAWRETAPSGDTAEVHDAVIMHIDMDCFFASVALRNHPELKGEPVAVTHAKRNSSRPRPGVDRKFEYDFYKRRVEERLGVDHEDDSSEEEESATESRGVRWTEAVDSLSEIASCSYEARKAGVRNGMFLGTALKLCPNLKTVPYDFEGYKEVSFALYNTIGEYTMDMEAVSCDELFVDCGSVLRECQATPLQLATLLRQEIRDKTRCPCSVGLGANKLQARLATKRAKPDGQFFLSPATLSEFMAGVDVCDLPGVGRTLNHKAKALNVKTCGDLQKIPMEILKKEFGGKTGEMLYKFSRGIDERAVKSTHQRKSVSAEVNYGIRFTNDGEAATFFRQLSAEVSHRLKEIRMRGRSLTLKLMVRAKDAPLEAAKFLGHGACDHVTKTSALPLTDDSEVVAKHVLQIYNQLSIPPSELRGIGIQMSKLEAVSNAPGTLQQFLQPEGAKKPAKKLAPKNFDKLKLPPASQVDPDVLESLPIELRAEIMNQYGTTRFEKRKPPIPTSDQLSYSQIDQDVLAELPREIQEEIESEVKRRPKGLWDDLELGEVRTMVREWVRSEEAPRQCDTDMLRDHLRLLVERRCTEHVDILLKGLRRHVEEVRGDDLEWCRTFQYVVEGVQETMLRVYGKKLAVAN